MKKQKIAVLAIVFLLAPGLVAERFDKMPVVKVTGGRGLNWHYVEYTINGKKFRSDRAGSRINFIAVRFMSDEDLDLVASYYGWHLDARIEDFTKAGAQIVADRANIKQGWSRLYDKIQQKWSMVDMPGLAERLDDMHRSDYFINTLCPHFYDENGNEDMGWLKEASLYERYVEMLGYMDVATQAYKALERFNARKHKVSVQFISGELIQIIVDQVLVPRITPSSAIDLAGTKFGIRKAVLGVVYDKLNANLKISESLIDLTIGKVDRVDFSEVQHEMEQMNYMIELDKELIFNSVDRIKQHKAAIEKEYPAILEKRRTARETAEKAARRLKETAAADNRTYLKEELNVPDPSIEARYAAFNSDTDRKKYITELGRSVYDEATEWYANYGAGWDKLKPTEPMDGWYEGVRDTGMSFTSSGVCCPSAKWKGQVGTLERFLLGRYDSNDPAEADLALRDSAVSAAKRRVEEIKDDYRGYMTSRMTWVENAYKIAGPGLAAYAALSKRRNSVVRHGGECEGWRELMGKIDLCIYDAHDDVKGWLTGMTTFLSGYLNVGETLDIAYSPALLEQQMKEQLAKAEGKESVFDAARTDYLDLQEGRKQAMAALEPTLDEFVRAHDDYLAAYDSLAAMPSKAPDFMLDYRQGLYETRWDYFSDQFMIKPNTDSILAQTFQDPDRDDLIEEAERILGVSETILDEYQSYRCRMEAALETMMRLDTVVSIATPSLSSADAAAVKERLPFRNTSSYWRNDDINRYGVGKKTYVLMGDEVHSYINGARNIEHDFTMNEQTCALMECAYELRERGVAYSVEGLDDAGYSDLKLKIKYAMDPKSHGNAARIPGYSPWSKGRDVYTQCITPALKEVETLRKTKVGYYRINYTREAGSSETNTVYCFRNQIYRLAPNEFTPPTDMDFVGWCCESTKKRFDSGLLFFNLAAENGTITLMPVWE